MDSKEFENKVKQELKKLDTKQHIEFAWRCAVRALPFLGDKGNFGFWIEKDKQRHLYAVFDALDTNINTVTAYAASKAAATSVTRAATNATNAATNAATAYAATTFAATTFSDTAANATNAATSVAA
jgi:hypothetical protein